MSLILFSCCPGFLLPFLSHPILKFFPQLQVVIGEEKFHAVSGMSFGITLTRPAVYRFVYFVGKVHMHSLKQAIVFFDFLSIIFIICDPWLFWLIVLQWLQQVTLLRLTVLQWLQQVTPNLHIICKLTYYQEIIQIWSLSFKMEMERFLSHRAPFFFLFFFTELFYRTLFRNYF